MYSKYIMSNPFIKNTTLNSGERTERLASYSKVATLRKNKATTSNYIDDYITMKNNVVTQAVDHKTLLSYTKGYFYTKDCDISSNTISSVTDGLYSVLDLSNNNIYDASGQLLLDNCELIESGLGIKATRNPLLAKREFAYPTPLKIEKDTCTLPVLNNIADPVIHLPDNSTDSHTHYFPNNLGTISYTHVHNVDPHPDNKTETDPFPHIADYTTNQNTSEGNVV